MKVTAFIQILLILLKLFGILKISWLLILLPVLLYALFTIGLIIYLLYF